MYGPNAHLHPQLQAVAVHETFDLEVHQAWVLEAEELEDFVPLLRAHVHGSLLAIGLEGLVHRGVQVLAVVHGRQVQVLRVRLPQMISPPSSSSTSSSPWLWLVSRKEVRLIWSLGTMVSPSAMPALLRQVE